MRENVVYLCTPSMDKAYGYKFWCNDTVRLRLVRDYITKKCRKYGLEYFHQSDDPDFFFIELWIGKRLSRAMQDELFYLLMKVEKKFMWEVDII